LRATKATNRETKRISGFATFTNYKFHALPPVLRSELAFSRKPGGKLNGAEPNGSSVTDPDCGCGDTDAATGIAAVVAAAVNVTAPAVTAGTAVTAGPAVFCSVGVSVDVVEADLAVIPRKALDTIFN